MTASNPAQAQNALAKRRIAGLYAITPEITDTGALLVKVRAAIEGGARVVQYRDKSASSDKRLEQALGLSALTQKFGALLIINDDVKLALDVEADGVHLGRDDGDIAAARKKLGTNRLIGASCYASIDAARAALAAGADHVAFGSVFTSSTKPQATPAPLTLFDEAKSLNAPLVAIGGITHTNAPAVIHAGADALAVITDLFDAPDIRARAQQFSRLFAQPTST
jgi:thiamine-phosphate pyrophosphorylase